MKAIFSLSRIVIPWFFLIGLSIECMAQNQFLELPQAVQEALKNSPQIKVAESQADSQNWKKAEAFSGHLPVVSIGGNYLVNKKYVATDVNLPGAPASISMEQVIPTSIWTANLQVPIFDGFATSSRVAASEHFKEGAEANLEWQRFQLQREVILQFYKYIASEQLLKTAEQNQLALEDHLKDVRLFKSAGLSTNYDVLRVEVQVSESKSEVMNAQDNLQMAQLRLAEMMGVDTTALSSLPKPQGSLPIIPKTLNSAGFQSNIGLARKDLDSMRLRLNGFEQSSIASSRHFYPKISLFGQFQYYNNKSDSPIARSDFRSAYSTGLSLNWVLFDGFASSARAHVAVDDKIEMQFNLESRTRRAVTDSEFWKRRLSYFLTLFQARNGDIGKSEESVRLARIGQKEGSRTTSDLLDSESELFRAKAGSINAQIGSIEALINLELATGKAIYKFF